MHTDDPLETAVDELLESTTFSCPATTTTCLQPVAVPPKQEVDPPALPPGVCACVYGAFCILQANLLL